MIDIRELDQWEISAVILLSYINISFCSHVPIHTGSFHAVQSYVSRRKLHVCPCDSGRMQKHNYSPLSCSCITSICVRTSPYAKRPFTVTQPSTFQFASLLRNFTTSPHNKYSHNTPTTTPYKSPAKWQTKMHQPLADQLHSSMPSTASPRFLRLRVHKIPRP